MLGDAIAVPALVQISDVQSKPNSYDFLVLTEWREELEGFAIFQCARRHEEKGSAGIHTGCLTSSRFRPASGNEPTPLAIVSDQIGYQRNTRNMAGSTFQTNPFDLNKLLEDCHRGILQLPDFQRSWVWDEDRIKSLIASVSRAFPVGALMSLDTGGPVNFKPRPVEGAPAGGETSRLLSPCCLMASNG